MSHPEYWLIDLQNRVMDIYALQDGRYGDPTRHGPGEQRPPAAAPEITMPLDHLFG